jgi:hypothetical protein
MSLSPRERIREVTRPVSLFFASVTVGVTLGFVISAIAKFFLHLSDTNSIAWVGIPFAILFAGFFWRKLPRDF